MGRRIKPIGGEFWCDNKIFNNSADNLNKTEAVLLNGGQSSIEFILQDIKLRENEHILMPSYLCPTILYKFKKYNINILFYEINGDLSINIESVSRLIEKFNIKALFFINYFGFYHNNMTIEYLRNLRNNGLILIEDAVQMLWFKRLNKFIGDYIFNSYRKFFPVDGSLVLCNKTFKFNTIKDEYYSLINQARINKTKYIENNIGEEEEFLGKFSEAERWYYKRKTINGMDAESKQFLRSVNYPWIKDQRLINYNYLYDNLYKLNKVRLLFHKDQIEDNVPLVLPVLINNRDFVREELRKHNIYCPVHWDITEESWAVNFPKSLELSKSLLSIPMDWRYDKEDMNYFLGKFSSVLVE
ncbi:MAG: DegT/DnrJ/EryC1/StrS aminotransferase family protein [Tissierellia bacterium]|nr:DegT/DnrJ/EryC1/StrS aminotransferase family protein [Tissierellia bacterium]MDD4781267.1 DegT/DnrJ/EryC1/StrS aminotransferase family protein [Tissierellia bacterium]